jgi:hypothetical protein
MVVIVAEGWVPWLLVQGQQRPMAIVISTFNSVHPNYVFQDLGTLWPWDSKERQMDLQNS